MQTSLSGLGRRGSIIGLVLLLLASLAGCSVSRLGYNQAPQLAHWWLDGYLDLRNDQSPRVKSALEQWFDWHRSTQLADYASLLASAQGQVMAPVTPAQICRWGEALQARLEPAVERALPLVADLVPTVTSAQLDHLALRYAKSNRELRKSHLQTDPVDRQRASAERTVDRLESFYGPLDDRQERLVLSGLVSSPFDAEVWMAEREARQHDILRTLRAVVAGRPHRDALLGSLRQLAQRLNGPSSSDARAYQERLTAYNCDFGARLHNATNERQRRHAREKLHSWEQDALYLAGAAAVRRPGSAAGPSHTLVGSAR